MQPLPQEALRRQLASLGIPVERQGLADLLCLLPEGSGIPNDADAVAEALIYLVRKRLIDVPSPLEASLGLPSLGLQWGTHLCQFYRSPEELLELVLPFLRQGLKDHERCVWVVAPPMRAKRARAALEAGIPELERHPDQICVYPYPDFYLDASGKLMSLEKVMRAWVQAEERALDEGYAGLRVAGDMLYERQLHRVLACLRVKALCTYSAGCNPDEVAQAVASHDTAYIKRDQSWHRIPAGPRAASTIFASLNP